MSKSELQGRGGRTTARQQRGQRGRGRGNGRCPGQAGTRGEGGCCEWLWHAGRSGLVRDRHVPLRRLQPGPRVSTTLRGSCSAPRPSMRRRCCTRLAVHRRHDRVAPCKMQTNGPVARYRVCPAGARTCPALPAPHVLPAGRPPARGSRPRPSCSASCLTAMRRELLRAGRGASHGRSGMIGVARSPSRWRWPSRQAQMGNADPTNRTAPPQTRRLAWAPWRARQRQRPGPARRRRPPGPAALSPAAMPMIREKAARHQLPWLAAREAGRTSVRSPSRAWSRPKTCL
jgi:hypothetical protein